MRFCIKPRTNIISWYENLPEADCPILFSAQTTWKPPISFFLSFFFLPFVKCHINTLCRLMETLFLISVDIPVGIFTRCRVDVVRAAKSCIRRQIPYSVCCV